MLEMSASSTNAIKHVDADATTPTTRSMNSVIQTVHAFLMHRHSLSNILVHAGGTFFWDTEYSL